MGVSAESAQGFLQLVSDRVSIDTVHPGISSRGELLVTNTGSAPVWLTRVATSCTCTDVDYDEEVVMPGDTLTLRVTYTTSRTMPGKVRQTIYINATGDNPRSVAFIEAELVGGG